MSRCRPSAGCASTTPTCRSCWSCRPRGDVDVIHNNSLHYLPIALAATRRAPMVTTLHTPPTPWLEPAIGLMDQAGPGSSPSARTRRGHWAHVADAEVIHNGVDVERWRAGPGGEDLRLVRPAGAREGAAPGDRPSPRPAGGGSRLAGPIVDEAYFADAVRPLLGPGAEYVGHLGSATSGAGRLQRRHPGDPGVGRALRPGGRGVARLRHPVLAFDRGGLGEFVSPECGVLVAGRRRRRPRPRPSTAVAALDRDACREHAVQSLLARADDRRLPAASTTLLRALGRCRVIGYYAHHHGSGHITRLQASPRTSARPVVGLSSRRRPGGLAATVAAARPRRRHRAAPRR